MILKEKEEEEEKDNYFSTLIIFNDKFLFHAKYGISIIDRDKFSPATWCNNKANDVLAKKNVSRLVFGFRSPWPWKVALRTCRAEYRSSPTSTFLACQTSVPRYTINQFQSFGWRHWKKFNTMRFFHHRILITFWNNCCFRSF